MHWAFVGSGSSVLADVSIVSTGSARCAAVAWLKHKDVGKNLVACRLKFGRQPEGELIIARCCLAYEDNVAIYCRFFFYHANSAKKGRPASQALVRNEQV